MTIQSGPNYLQITHDHWILEFIPYWMVDGSILVWSVLLKRTDGVTIAVHKVEVERANKFLSDVIDNGVRNHEWNRTLILKKLAEMAEPVPAESGEPA